MFKTPVLLIIYNRIEDTHNLFQVVRKVKPSKLYFAADGHNKNVEGDYVNCLRTRSVIMPEWECELNKKISEEHLGKAKHIFSAITWFFENEPEGIILFDDTLPHTDFFPYCQQLLERYRNNDKVKHIGASHLKRKYKAGKASYYYSAYASTWGFATWRDTWQGFDLALNNLEKDDLTDIISQYMEKRKEKKYWSKVFNILKKYELDYWNFQYNMHIWKNKGLCVAPNTNLVKNVGFRGRKRKIRKLMKDVFPVLPLRFPTEIKQDKVADRYIFRKVYKKGMHQAFFDWIKEHLLGADKKL